MMLHDLMEDKELLTFWGPSHDPGLKDWKILLKCDLLLELLAQPKPGTVHELRLIGVACGKNCNFQRNENIVILQSPDKELSISQYF